ncbi:MAG: hypothetical protein H6Q90_3294 [Deltaproteobacteria bacterium]|nr:hypothetical protein [Deltaproteobacteria bacterium]
MRRLVVAFALTQLAGCVTGASIVRPNRVSLPVLIGAAAADFVVTSLAASAIEDYSTGGSLATGAAVMAADVAVGCLLGGCSSLRP